jgi:hypothetical protein
VTRFTAIDARVHESDLLHFWAQLDSKAIECLLFVAPHQAASNTKKNRTQAATRTSYLKLADRGCVGLAGRPADPLAPLQQQLQQLVSSDANSSSKPVPDELLSLIDKVSNATCSYLC